jgi:hypothetical protein
MEWGLGPHADHVADSRATCPEEKDVEQSYGDLSEQDHPDSAYDEQSGDNKYEPQYAATGGSCGVRPTFGHPQSLPSGNQSSRQGTDTDTVHQRKYWYTSEREIETVKASYNRSGDYQRQPDHVDDLQRLTDTLFSLGVGENVALAVTPHG